MYTTSSNYKQRILEPSRKFESRIRIGNRTITNDEVTSLIIQQQMQQDATFSIGNTIASILNLNFLHNDVDTNDRDIISVEIGLLVNLEYEYIPLGVYNIEASNSNDTTTSIVAYDNMIKFDVPYIEENENPTVHSIVNRVIEITGVELNGNLSNYNDYPLSPLKGYSCREIIGHVAGAIGCNVIIDREGKFKLVNVSSNSNLEITSENYFNYFKQSKLYKISKLINVTNSSVFEIGEITDDTVCLNMNNPYINGEIIQDLHNKFNGMSFYPFELTWQGDPSIDLGDCISIVDTKGVKRFQPVLLQNLNYSGALNSVLQAQGDTKLANTYITKSSEESEMDRVKDETLENSESIDTLEITVATIDKAMINKLEAKDLVAINASIENLKATKLEAKDLTVINADITNLKANKAEVGQLNAANAEIANLKTSKLEAKDLTAINASIENLTTNKASIKDLEVTNAEIGSLSATVGNIQTLIGGNLTMDNIHSLVLTSTKVTVQDAFIKNAMVDNISANKINTGEINTGLVKIKSSDGSMVLTGSLQQFKDKNNKVRIQMGKDAQGNFTFGLFDETGVGTLIDSTGVKANAIANGLIVDTMINDNANIDGGKLDIDSVVTEVNNGTTLIKGTKIKLDKENQTLEVAFNSMKTTTTSTSNTVSAHTTSITTIQGQISTLISDTTIVEDGNTIKLKDAYSLLEQTVSGISSKVTDVESNLTNNYSTTVAMNSAIEQRATSILSTVSSTYTTKTDFDNLEIGGRNLGQNTDVYISGGYTSMTINSDVIKANKGKQIAVSVDINLYKALSSNLSGNKRLGMEFNITHSDGTITYYGVWESLDSTEKTINKRISRVLTISTKEITSVNILGIYIQGLTSGTAKVGRPKIELGNKPTDWTPAPEDVTSEISSVEQTANKINWLVKSGSGTSDMVLTDQLYSVLTTNISLTAKNITLEGLITANNNFKILTDGSIVATKGSFNGNISGSKITGSSFEATKVIPGVGIHTVSLLIDSNGINMTETNNGSTTGSMVLKENAITFSDVNSYASTNVFGLNEIHLGGMSEYFDVDMRDSTQNKKLQATIPFYIKSLDVSDGININGNSNFKYDLTVNGLLKATNNLSVDNNTYTKTLSTGGLATLNSLTVSGTTNLNATTLNGVAILKSTLSVDGVSTFIGEVVCNNYLSVNAWPGYGTGKAQLWYDGNTKNLIAQGINALRIGDNEVVHKGMYPSPGNWFNGGPVTIGTDGVMEIGRYIDFHNTSSTTSDYTARLDCTAQNKLQLGGTFVANDFQKGGYALGLSGEQSINNAGGISYMYLGDVLIAYGKVDYTGIVANATQTYALSFGKTFANAPFVSVIVNSSSPHQCSTGAGAVTNTGCNLYLTRTNTTNTSVFWMAIGKRAS